MRPLSLTIAVLLISFPAAAQQPIDPTAYARLLIPISTGRAIVPGAFGSRWTATTMIRNDGDQPTGVFPLDPENCLSFECQHMRNGIEANTTAWMTFGIDGKRHPAQVRSAGLYGGFVYVERARLSHLSAHVEFQDTSRTPIARVQLPVVGEDGFFTTTRSIVGIPINSASRATLRVFDDGSTNGGAVTIRIDATVPDVGPPDDPFRYTQTFAETMQTFVTQTQTCGFLFDCPDVRYQPDFIYIGDLLARFPTLAVASELEAGVRVEIEPLTPGLRYWPMVTVTDNETSHTTLYTVR